MDDNQSMAEEKIIYLSPEEELTNVCERLEKTKARSVTLVFPRQTQLLDQVEWRLLHSRVRELTLDVQVISSDRRIRALAKGAGFRIAEALEFHPSDSPRTINRSVHSHKSVKKSQDSKQQADSRSQVSSSLKPGQQKIPLSSSKNGSTPSDSDEIKEAVPSPRSTASDQEDEDIDLLQEDYSLAPSIREATQSADVEDNQPVALPEQTVSASIYNIDQEIPEISDVPQDDKIEDLDDEEDDLPPLSLDDQMPKKPSVQEIQLNHGVQPRGRRMGSTRRPSLDEDKLPVSQNLDTLINRRIEELRKTGATLAKIAERLAVRAMIIKILLIFLGALVATREVASELFGITSNVIMVIYTIIGVLIATLAGLEAAFRWENRSIELKNLAADTRAERRKLESAIIKNNSALASESVLDALDKESSEVQSKAATLGVNIVLVDATQPYHDEDLRKLQSNLKYPYKKR